MSCIEYIYGKAVSDTLRLRCGLQTRTSAAMRATSSSCCAWCGAGASLPSITYSGARKAGFRHARNVTVNEPES